ncbi:sigma-70 family RNA polymerase sigma factor [Paludisphaera soli]|uniref:sigma-70 family RNA polymerase sigma factor n=1 Tax=Paludisphaera soli TaxID=2712865 RepID=UPI0013EBF248|nr:sigma-70 family RNA polymerase sigma factor [Paludisphaera soli]
MRDPRRKRSDRQDLGVLLAEGSIGPKADADLLRLFLHREGESAEAAFSALVERHGPMVLGLCRRVLRDEHAAEDAFQAVFLVLARKARSVQVDDSLGRWLHGVARKVAARARRRAARQVPAEADPGRVPQDPAVDAARAEIRDLVAREVARLPRKYREVASMCHLDGLSHLQAAEALGLPVGTVRSRLSRARDLLRPRLIRRGLAPASATALVASRATAATIPAVLARSTTRLAVGRGAAVASPAVLALLHETLRSLTMGVATRTSILLLGLCGLTAGAFTMARDPDSPQQPPPAAARPEPQAPSLEQEMQRIIREYQEAKAHAADLGKAKADSPEEQRKVVDDAFPKLAEYAGRINDLAAKSPKETAARDGLIWVATAARGFEAAEADDEAFRAARLLLEHHGDDPETARAGLEMEASPSWSRDAFLRGIHAVAENREARGLIRYGLATYLYRKAKLAADLRKAALPPSTFTTYGRDEQGREQFVQRALPVLARSYQGHLRSLDSASLQAESERLFDEVVADYADAPYISILRRNLERETAKGPSAAIADPAERKSRERAESFVSRPPTLLGDLSAELLDESRHLSEGKPAREIEGAGVDGTPIKLSALRGRVVAVCFWMPGCEDCRKTLSWQRALMQRWQRRPFTFLGVALQDSGDARKILEGENANWPSILTGGSAVAKRYHAQGHPTYCIVDEEGTIRRRGHFLTSNAFETFVGRLLAEVNHEGPPADRASKTGKAG